MQNLIMNIEANELKRYLNNQLNIHFPDNKENFKQFSKYVDNALIRLEFCFSQIKLKHFSENGKAIFNYLNGDQYCMFLYFVSNEAYQNDDELYYSKCSLLNKFLFSIDLFGHIKMPEIFLLVHPLGTVIGRAKFDDYLVIYQNVTIGGVHSVNNSILYPSFGKGVILYSKTSVLGNAHISDNTIIVANTSIIGEDYDENSLIIGNYPKNKTKLYIQNVKDIFFI
jgi:serine O-acetyltransferase